MAGCLTVAVLTATRSNITCATQDTYTYRWQSPVTGRSGLSSDTFNGRNITAVDGV